MPELSAEKLPKDSTDPLHAAPLASGPKLSIVFPNLDKYQPQIFFSRIERREGAPVVSKTSFILKVSCILQRDLILKVWSADLLQGFN